MCSALRWRNRTQDQGPASWRPTTVKWRQFSQSNRHYTIGTRQTKYHEVLPSSANVQSHLTSSFADDGNASWYSVCRVPMVEWRLHCENCRHLTVVGLHFTGPSLLWQFPSSHSGDHAILTSTGKKEIRWHYETLTKKNNNNNKKTKTKPKMDKYTKVGTKTKDWIRCYE